MLLSFNTHHQDWHMEDFQLRGRVCAFLVCVDWQGSANAKCHDVSAVPHHRNERNAVECARSERSHQHERQSSGGMRSLWIASRPGFLFLFLTRFYPFSPPTALLKTPWLLLSASSCVNKPQNAF